MSAPSRVDEIRALEQHIAVCHDVIADVNALIDCNFHADLNERIDAILTPCDHGDGPAGQQCSHLQRHIASLENAFNDKVAALEQERDEYKALASVGTWHADCRPNRKQAAETIAKQQAENDKLADTISSLSAQLTEKDREIARLQQELRAAKHEQSLIEVETRRGITDASTPLHIRAQNIRLQLEKAESDLTALQTAHAALREALKELATATGHFRQTPCPCSLPQDCPYRAVLQTETPR